MKLLKRLLAICLAVLTVCALCPRQAQAADTDRYGYDKLANEKQKQLYVLIADAVSAGEDKLTLSGKNFSESDLKSAEAMVRRDYPEFFYYTSYRYSVNSSGVVQSMEMQYMIDGKTIKGSSAELKAARAKLDAVVKEAVKGATGDDFHKAHYLHDYIVNNVTYQTSKNDQTAYGALIDGKAVCAGYSHAYQLLLHKVGIESFYITGTSKGVRHAWLLVFLNGDCYYTDVTWDDPKTNDGSQMLGHYYLDMSYNDISKDHVADPEYAPWLPAKHDHKEMCYFEHEAGNGTGVGNFTDKTDPEQLFKTLKRDGNVYRCEFVYKGSDFEAWFNEALQNVANNVGEIGISYTMLGGEYILTITAKAAEHVLQKIPAKAPTCLADGNKEHWQCQKCGKRFADADAITWLSNESCVVIDKLGHSNGNGDNKCDICGNKLSSSTVTPPTNATEPTAPSNNATEPTAPSNNETEPTVPSNNTTEATTPSGDATEATTPAGDVTDETAPGTDAPEDVTDPTENGEDTPNSTKPSENTVPDDGKSQSDETAPMELTTIVIIGAAVAVVVIILIRKKFAA